MDANPWSRVVLAVTAVGCLVASSLPLAGLDREVLLALGIGVVPIPLALPALVLFGGLSGLTSDARMRRLWPVLYALTVGLYALRVARELEAASWGSAWVVLVPGAPFRLVTVASALGLGGLVWAAAQRAEATGRVRGVIWVAGCVMALQAITQLQVASVAWVLGGTVPLGWWVTIALTSAEAGRFP